ncbi:hypothetical protein [Amphritea japonica]|uniref:Lipoprotein n=1 Tax=Amphritea japonica ATCC BAA-1530 TaxID=1278309 RepID=A0A7R6PQ35_9GAMM|nr:hypothetical protein [Amphritea japonica]BBB27448.1 conserved hypothetical protein [Amphritea japonica ATCC BAA-1530]
MSVSIYRPLFILLPLLLSILLSGCSEESAPTEKAGVAVQSFHLNPENQSELIERLAGDYLESSEKLTQQFLMSRKAEDAQGFIRYRNESWTPEYMSRKEFYQQIQHLNKAYIYRHQLNGLFDSFMHLQKLSLHLKHSLQNSDSLLAEQVMVKLAEDQEIAISYLSDFRPVRK